MEIGNKNAARGPAGKVSSSRLTPPAASNGRRWREWGGERLYFTVRDLIARRFHYLCTNVTFSSDQGARQPLAARLASRQTIVQKELSQSGLPGQTEVRRGTERLQYAKDMNTKERTLQHSGGGRRAACRQMSNVSLIPGVKLSAFVLICYYFYC